MRRVGFLFAVLLAAVVVGAGSASADLVLGLRYDDGSTAKVVNSGDTVFVDLFLSDTDGSTPLAAEGLLTGGGRLLRAGGAVTLVPGAISDVDGLWGAGVFDTNPASAGGPQEIAKVLGATDFLFGPPAGVGQTLVRIARFAIQVFGVATQNGTIRADILDPNVIANVSFGGTDLDGMISSFGSVNLTISGNSSPVPEPASMMLAAVTGAMAGGAVWRRRRAQKARS